MATGGAWMSGSTPGLAIRVRGPDQLVDRLPADVSRATIAAAKRADVLVVDRRTSETRTERTGEADIAGRTVLVVPKRPGARPSVTCYSTEAPEADPAVDLVRRTVELDATADAHFGVASAVAVASDDEPASGGRDGADWVAADAGEDALGAGAADESHGLLGPAGSDARPDATPGDGGATGRAGHADVSPSAAELAARRDSVDTAASRVLEEGPDAAAPLAFCGLSAVVEPLDGV